MKPSTSELLRTNSLGLGLVVSGAALLCLIALKETTTVHAAPQIGLVSGIRATIGPAQVVESTSPHGPFHVRSYAGRCLTYGGGKPLVASTGASSTASTGTTPPPVYLDDCNGQERFIQGITAQTRQQQVVVQEINSQHHVVLRAGGKVIGVMGGFLINQAPLELQDLNYSVAQVFALDGDSIVLVADRELVVRVQNGRGAIGTPLVLGSRELADSEFWSFEATDGSDQRPTSGFVRVPQDWGLEQALLSAGPGTVIDVDPSYALSLDGRPTLFIPGGVTIRGNRRGGEPMGPEVSKTTYDISPMFEVNGDDARITGMRLRGPSVPLITIRRWTAFWSTIGSRV